MYLARCTTWCSWTKTVLLCHVWDMVWVLWLLSLVAFAKEQCQTHNTGVSHYVATIPLQAGHRWRHYNSQTHIRKTTWPPLSTQSQHSRFSSAQDESIPQKQTTQQSRILQVQQHCRSNNTRSIKAINTDRMVAYPWERLWYSRPHLQETVQRLGRVSLLTRAGLRRGWCEIFAASQSVFSRLEC